jgi:hypothetical protein
MHNLINSSKIFSQKFKDSFSHLQNMNKIWFLENFSSNLSNSCENLIFWKLNYIENKYVFFIIYLIKKKKNPKKNIIPITTWKTNQLKTYAFEVTKHLLTIMNKNKFNIF